jgi:deoxyhypusine synthase
MSVDGSAGHRQKKASIKDRKSKVDIGDFARMPQDFGWYRHLEMMIPRILKGADLYNLAGRVAEARQQDKGVIVMLGAHVVKCGLGGLVCELLRRRIVTAVAMNGACAIHDIEIAMWGKTSEDVVEGLKTGEFGMASETADFFNEAAALCLEDRIGLGAALGRKLADAHPANGAVSIITAATEMDIPPTVHVAIGTDIVHQHEQADGKAIGYGTMTDFRRFASLVANIDGGVILNLGSAVVMPEVFLKALAMARNAGAALGDFTTANFDMFSLYRPMTNVVARPKTIGATTFSFLGHHEILLPVFVASLMSRLRV